MYKSDILSPAPPNFKWPRCAKTESFIRSCIDRFLKKHSFARQLSQQMEQQTSTDFLVWVDHLVLPQKEFDEGKLRKDYGFLRDKKASPYAKVHVLKHPYADLPPILLNTDAKHMSCAIHVENVSHFKLIHDLTGPIEGAPYSSYRVFNLPNGESELLVVERHGGHGYDPDSKHMADDYIKGVELWLNRKRYYDDDTKGMKDTLKLAQKLARDFGTGTASWIFLEAERAYWQKRNRAGQIQKARQDALGLGWANHDHHTFRSSRPLFPILIEILLTFGFKKRERFYPGPGAGWGAQVMEQPQSNLVIFADVDLTPEDAQVDFSTKSLPELPKPNTVGLWCALHGESMLQAGLHHLEAQFRFDQLRQSLKKQKVDMMAPFSNFSFLHQAFTKGEQWQVDPSRLEQVRKKGFLSDKAYKEIKVHGAVGSHLENLQRKEGFKGFNQEGVTNIIRDVNPEKQALKGNK